MSIPFRLLDFAYPFAIRRLRTDWQQLAHAPLEATEAYVRERLAAQLAWSLRQVPRYAAYRDTLLGQVAADPQGVLEALPVVTRADVQAQREQFLAQDRRGLAVRSYRTSATSFHPLSIDFDQHQRIAEFVYYSLWWREAGYRLGQPFAQIDREYEKGAEAERPYTWQPHLRRLLINPYLLGPDTAPLLVAELRRRGVRYLKGLATAVAWLAELVDMQQGPPLRLDAVFCTGDQVYPWHREQVRGTFHAPLLDSYGIMEGPAKIFQCGAGNYHVVEPFAHIEFRNRRPSGQPGTELADMVGTSLHNRAMPLLRYQLPDFAELYTTPQSCPCGKTWLRIKQVHGRTEDLLHLPDGRRIPLANVGFMTLEGVRHVQLVQEAENRLLVRVLPQDAWTQSQEQTVLARAQHLFGSELRTRVELATIAELERSAGGKIKRVINQVQPERTL